MNYCTQALHHIRAVCVASHLKGREADALALSWVVELLRVAEKFVIPPPEKIKVRANAGAMQWVRAPYPVYAIEYAITNPLPVGNYRELKCIASGKRIALVMSINHANPISRLARRVMEGRRKLRGNELVVLSIYHTEEPDLWIVAPGFGIVEPSELAEQELTNVDWRGARFEFSAAPFMMDMHEELMRQYTQEVGEANAMKMAQDSLFNDLGEEVTMAIRFTLLLNTKNVRAVPINNVPSKVNAKRERAGKAPFFTYHTINLFLNAPTRTLRRMDEGQIKTLFARQPREHTVIGHIKVRKTGPFWWRPFVRGDRATGFIDKDYVAKEK